MRAHSSFCRGGGGHRGTSVIKTSAGVEGVRGVTGLGLGVYGLENEDCGFIVRGFYQAAAL